MKLYGYFRSSAAYRVRIALNLKGLDYALVAVNLVDGEQHGGDNLARNPQGLVPTLETDNGTLLAQSLAICEYLDEHHPEPPLLPADTEARARVRALAQAIACEIHPLNNLRVLEYLTGELGLDETAKHGWYRHWISEGFEALEALLADSPATGAFCHGDTPTLADACLVPQVFNARRFECDLSAYPTLRRIAAHCDTLDAFQRAAPAAQPDAS
ncbi:maleylacetoacetate isomerase [Modicisalibacter radicis]|uniref:maleylacetoacetate isomerase n=1 Tax=Halomonas sp. EAR18 TaxID=2518972 RepID=UPI00109D087A|nr:maleylacetoacetate isomerase [Halomonas sp. EAR18]